MKRPRAKSTALTKLSRAIWLPNHVLTERLRKILDLIDKVHAPKNLKKVTLIMDRSVRGAKFTCRGAYGPYEILLNPSGSHPELSLVHEIGHYLEWQTIPKNIIGHRNFDNDAILSEWLKAMLNCPGVINLVRLRDQQKMDSKAYKDINYLLRPEELWARMYSQYTAKKSLASVLFQQIAAENKISSGGIMYLPYLPWDQFPLIEGEMDWIFRDQGWLK